MKTLILRPTCMINCRRPCSKTQTHTATILPPSLPLRTEKMSLDKVVSGKKVSMLSSTGFWVTRLWVLSATAQLFSKLSVVQTTLKVYSRTSSAVRLFRSLHSMKKAILWLSKLQTCSASISSELEAVTIRCTWSQFSTDRSSFPW